jgi:Homeodomain-like domain
MIKYRIYLTAEERQQLEAMVSKGKRKASAIRIAHVLLASDETTGRQSESAISEAYHLCTKTVERIRHQFCQSGMDIFTPQPRHTRSDKKIDGSVEAHILAICCSEPPAGQSRWKLQLIADSVVELGILNHISATSVATVLKKTNSSPGASKSGSFPQSKVRSLSTAWNRS